MLPHQERAIKEKEELVTRVIALQNFIENNPQFKELSYYDQIDLKLQNGIMCLYVEILDKRISKF